MTVWDLPSTYTFQSHEIRYGVVGAGPPLVLIHKGVYPNVPFGAFSCG